MASMWRDGTQCVVTLTFDIDGPSATLRRNPELADHPSVISMGEFGPKVGTRRIVELLAHHGIAATFFVPGWVAERNEQLVKDVAAAGHEIAHHGYLHEPPSSLGPDEDEGGILDRGSEILAGITGERPRGYRSPSWELSADSLNLMHERGFTYDSSLMGDDVPYFVGDPGKQIIELPVHWSLDDAPYYTFTPVAGRTAPIATPNDVLTAWQWEFDGAYRAGRMMMLTMHPHTSGRFARLEALNRLIQHMKSRPRVSFMRCIDAAEMWRDQQP
ncbi:MAG: polysaccharide deacetylase [Chloroflexi bacterium]|nr:polysaccharide deacetylase [Chloroflexota bacterium]